PSSSSNAVPSNLGIDKSKETDGGGDGGRTKWDFPHHINQSVEPGKKNHWAQSKSLRLPHLSSPGLEDFWTSKDIQSPRFQAIMRVTSGRRRKRPDVKSFSHELCSKGGVRPFPFWKPRAYGRTEEIMSVISTKFVRLKEEVDNDLGILAGDWVSILEKNEDADPKWKEILEDLLVVARKCAKMSPNEFWLKCEGIVQNLDDRRQELPMGTLKQAHTRMLFILTRCTRLVQFQKEGGFEDEHILGLHQLSDLGVYPEQIFGGGRQGFKNSLSGKEASEKHAMKSNGQEQSSLTMYEDLNFSSADPSTAKSVDSSTSRDRISSWKKLPSAAEKNQSKGMDESDTPLKDKMDASQHQDKTKSDVEDNAENINTPQCPLGSADLSSNEQKVCWGDQQNVAYENMICRICEVEIPTVHVEDHSRICAIADRCDLKGLTVNERLERVAETLEKILESLTPKSCDTSRSPDASSVADVFDPPSPKQNSLSCQSSEHEIDSVPEADNVLSMNDLEGLPNLSCKPNSIIMPDQGKVPSSAGSTTPRSPLVTPRTGQIELLKCGRTTMSELENFQQINKLLDIAHAVASINTNDYSALEFLVCHLEDLKYAIEDRKVDALIVETFGRRIEKLLQEKYVHLCGQIDDEKADSSSIMLDEYNSCDDDGVRSLRVNINQNCKDRTSIEDFEIIKPISRGAFGRVFLARKRATGDLFAIKVLKKADMIRKNAVESILAERNILISVRNPFVVRFFYSFTCRENLYLVMEYLNGGDLYSLLRNLGCLDEDMARVYMAEVVLALEYMHSLNVIHRDLKPDNLLIAHDGHIKLTDFGLSKVGLINSTDDLSGPSVSSSEIIGDNEPKTAERQTSKREQRQKHSAVGTPDYLAPEILLGMGHGATADWWSVGVILFELLVGIPPFNAEHPQQIFDNIMNRDIPWPKIPEEMSCEAYDLIDKLLTENPVQRLGATGTKEVKCHSFFKNINWDTLARQKAAFIPAAEGAYDTSYFTSRYVWNMSDENVRSAACDFDSLSETCSLSCSGSSFSNQLDEDGDECGNLADFSAPALAVKYSFSNFSFKNLSQLASINYDLVVKSSKDSPDASKPSIP
ncbi:probable serine/threonine protein kinase IRE, partial [Macadamia integrifolia]|uniref:probable serine/threonine protein kinase IRE n=1 Tax=Macadamia integrifolia TaxID=60698 RepID=UPI001C4E53C8